MLFLAMKSNKLNIISEKNFLIFICDIFLNFFCANGKLFIIDLSLFPLYKHIILLLQQRNFNFAF